MFPLTGVMLLPGTVLPLHIFEPRYRAMVEDAQKEKGTFSISNSHLGFIRHSKRESSLTMTKFTADNRSATRSASRGTCSTM